MSVIENYLRDEIRKVDKRERRTGRSALRNMVAVGQIGRADLERVVAPERGYRKAVRHLTVQDLIDMGIITVVEEQVAL